MFKSLLNMSTSGRLWLVGIFTVMLLGTMAGGVLFLRRASSAAVDEPILKLNYCGADPKELCILSFRRDQEENMVVDVFVPNNKLPRFYLKITRAAAESVYDCKKDRTVSKRMNCTGNTMGLQEKLEIKVLSLEDDHLIAFGKLTLRAILLSPSGGDNETQVSETPTVNVEEDLEPTLPLPVEIIETITPDPEFDNLPSTSLPVFPP